MIIFTHYGQTTVLTGWRAWVVGVLAFAVLVVIAALVIFVMLGVALTVGAVLLIVVPAAAAVALLASAFGSNGGHRGR